MVFIMDLTSYWGKGNSLDGTVHGPWPAPGQRHQAHPHHVHQGIAIGIIFIKKMQFPSYKTKLFVFIVAKILCSSLGLFW